MHRPAIRYSTDWLSEGLRQLDAIERLPDGWDSRGGSRPEALVVEAGRKLLAALAAADEDLSKPHVHPTPSGGVQFHWETPARYFEIEVLDAQTIQFYYLDRDEKQEAEGVQTLDAPLDEIVNFARRAQLPI